VSLAGRLRDVIGARIVARSAALADRVERARGRQPVQREDLDDALASTRAEIAAIHASVGDLAALRGSLDELAALRQTLEAISDRLEDVQAMAARAYEAALDWPAQLTELRAAQDYEQPWDEREPLVTVRIATYNNARILCERTLPSVLAQTYERWEAIVVGDAVEDDTEGRIANLGDGRVRFINLPFRGPYPDAPRGRWLIAGTAPANRGLAEARGDWIAPLDHDDAFAPDHIEVLLREARRTHAEVVFGRLRILDSSDNLPLGSIGEWPPRRSEFAWQASLYHRSLRRFHYDERARFAGEPGDWNLGRRLWEAGVRFAFLDDLVGDYYYTPKDEADRMHLEWLRRQALGLGSQQSARDGMASG
jgi:hypothetical protein